MPDSIISLVDRLLPVALISFVPLLVFDAMVLDRLVRLEYNFHRRNWEKDGKPLSPFFVPPQSTMLGGLWVGVRSRHALNRITIAWFFKTPNWMQHEVGAGWLLLLHRLLWSSLLLFVLGPFLGKLLL